MQTLRHRGSDKMFFENRSFSVFTVGLTVQGAELWNSHNMMYGADIVLGYRLQGAETSSG